MSPLRRAAGRTFHSLRSRSFRIYFTGQVISGAGSWMQQVGQAWLVLRLTGSGLALGVTLALQFTPILVGGAWSGVIVDRVDKRRLLMATAVAAGVLAAALGALTAAGVVEVWMVYTLAFLLGCVTAIDNPARRAFVPELVPRADIANAVGLNSAVFTGARVVGPAIAGLVIAGVGIAWCFLLNAASFAAVIIAFARMRPDEIRAAPVVARGRRQLRDGLHYAWANPEVRLALVMVAVISTIAFNYQVVLPVLARRELGGDAAVFGTLMGVMGVGSLGGALFAAHHGRASRRLMIWSAFALGVSMVGAACAPTLGLEMVALVPMGASSMVFLAMATALCNEATPPQLRGRVMALFAVAFLGSTPIGAPIVGSVTELLGARAGLALGAVATLATAVGALAFVRRHDTATSSVPVGEVTLDTVARAA